LMVLTRGCGMSTRNTIGALKHFQCKPEPVALLDALEADGSDRMIAVHRQVSGATGVGETNYFKNDKEEDSGGEYLLVTGEDTVRGLHLDGLDVVIVVGQPHGPDEYTHIAGRTGRAGKPGKVINVVSSDGTAHFKSWERMLDVDFEVLSMDDIGSLL
jgi:superfamily II DNA/RNA helicase